VSSAYRLDPDDGSCAVPHLAARSLRRRPGDLLRPRRSRARSAGAVRTQPCRPPVVEQPTDEHAGRDTTEMGCRATWWTVRGHLHRPPQPLDRQQEVEDLGRPQGQAMSASGREGTVPPRHEAVAHHGVRHRGRTEQRRSRQVEEQVSQQSAHVPRGQARREPPRANEALQRGSERQEHRRVDRDLPPPEVAERPEEQPRSEAVAPLPGEFPCPDGRARGQRGGGHQDDGSEHGERAPGRRGSLPNRGPYPCWKPLRGAHDGRLPDRAGAHGRAPPSYARGPAGLAPAGLPAHRRGEVIRRRGRRLVRGDERRGRGPFEVQPPAREPRCWPRAGGRHPVQPVASRCGRCRRSPPTRRRAPGRLPRAGTRVSRGRSWPRPSGAAVFRVRARPPARPGTKVTVRDGCRFPGRRFR
jgi:hypothetical protein